VGLSGGAEWALLGAVGLEYSNGRWSARILKARREPKMEIPAYIMMSLVAVGTLFIVSTWGHSDGFIQSIIIDTRPKDRW
jgi:hypothetical protein